MSVLVSLCHIKLEIDKLMDHNAEEVEEAGAASVEYPVRKRVRGQRMPCDISIETFVNKAYETKEAINFLPASYSQVTADDGSSGRTLHIDDTTFFSGNPFVEVTKGILHFYKNNELIEIKNGLSKTLCLLAVPATVNCSDLLTFVAACYAVIQHIRIIRDGSPNQYMVLLEFRSIESAMEFYNTYNGAPYNSLEVESLCHAVWVSNVEWGEDDTPPLGHTELPTCPVCLERMDESVDGVLTILCNHTFHANCLVKWGDSTCPVCRYVQTPELTETSVCMECDGAETLWICLICGHIGCGRYQAGHAAAHYRSTNHTYALQLGTNRVWDYVGDNFVHRLLLNKSDGKLVATRSPSEEVDKKADSMQLEFTYILTAQLDTQREYYEERLSRFELTVSAETEKLRAETSKVLQKNNDLETKVGTLTKEKNALEKKVTQLSTRMATVLKDLAEERQVGKALRSNQTSWQTKYDTLDAKYKLLSAEKEHETKDLKDQLRDLMFYMDAQNVIANSELKDEIATGSVFVQENPKEKTRKKKNTNK